MEDKKPSLAATVENPPKPKLINLAVNSTKPPMSESVK